MLPALFADASSATAAAGSLDAANPTVFLGLLIGGAVVLVTLVDKVDAIVSRRKRTPSIDVEFARKAELTALDARVTEEIRTMRSYFAKSTRELHERIEGENRITRDQITKLAESLNADFKSLYRALGKVEGVTLEKGD